MCLQRFGTHTSFCFNMYFSFNKSTKRETMSYSPTIPHIMNKWSNTHIEVRGPSGNLIYKQIKHF